MFIKLELIEQLKNLGLQPGQIVFLHASMRAVGKILGGPDELHQAIKECVSPQGALMMYVGCEPEYEAVGRGKFTAAEEMKIHDNCPGFNPHTARARRDYGILAEFFRSWGSKRKPQKFLTVQFPSISQCFQHWHRGLIFG